MRRFQNIKTRKRKLKIFIYLCLFVFDNSIYSKKKLIKFLFNLSFLMTSLEKIPRAATTLLTIFFNND